MMTDLILSLREGLLLFPATDAPRSNIFHFS